MLTPLLKLDSTWFQRLKLQYDEPLSNFAFKFNLRHYNWATNGTANSPEYSKSKTRANYNRITG